MTPPLHDARAWGGVWKLAKLSGGTDNSLRPWYGYTFSTNQANVTITFRD